MWPNETPEQEFANMILAMSEKEFNDWADKCSLEDVTRATEIIKVASLQLKEQIDTYIEETECEVEEVLECNYFPEAEEVLSKFMLQK
jgi:hypothetical protein